MQNNWTIHTSTPDIRKTMKNALFQMHSAKAVLSTLAAVMLTTTLAFADANPPARMTYQGYLTDANGAALAPSSPKNYNVVFRIYNAQTGGSTLWSEQQTLTVDKGYFSVLLGEGSDVTSSGSTEPHSALGTLFKTSDASDRYVEVTVLGIGTSGGNVTILPRLRLLTSPYAFLAQHSITANSLVNSTNGSVITISDSSVSIGNPISVTGKVTTTGAGADFDGNVTTTGAFVGNGTIPVGGIIMWSGSIASIPSGWALCNGQNGTPNLTDKFILAAGSSYQPGNTGGRTQVSLTVDNLPSHTHQIKNTWQDWSAGGWLAGNGGRIVIGGGSMTTEATGGNQAFSIMPPYYSLAYIMRTR